MEPSTQILMMLVFLGIATWAAMTAVIMQPILTLNISAWKEPRAFATASIVSGLMAVLMSPFLDVI